jgi:hypothetical protein
MMAQTNSRASISTLTEAEIGTTHKAKMLLYQIV